MARGPLLKTLVKKEKALLKARLDVIAKHRAKQFGSIKSIKRYIGDFIGKLDPTDLMIFSALMLFYGVGKKYNYMTAFIAASVDLALLKSQSDIGVGAAIAHIGVETLVDVFKDVKFVTPFKVPFKPGDPLVVGPV